MIQALPPLPPVDHSRQGVLTIAEPVLRGLLGLGDEYEVTRFALDTQGRLQVHIAGGDMPEMGLSPAPVSLVAHVQPDASIELSWAHVPEKRWRLP